MGNKVLALRVFISVLQAWKAENIRSLLGDLSFDWELGGLKQQEALGLKPCLGE